LIDFVPRSALAVALAQFEECRRLDRAFQMQVQFGLGELAEEIARQSVKAGGHYLLIVDSWAKICEEGREHQGETESRKRPGSSTRSRDTRETL